MHSPSVVFRNPHGKCAADGYGAITRLYPPGSRSVTGKSVFSLISLTEGLRPRPSWHASSAQQKKNLPLSLSFFCSFSVLFLFPVPCSSLFLFWFSFLCLFSLPFLSSFPLFLSSVPFLKQRREGRRKERRKQDRKSKQRTEKSSTARRKKG